jgi:transcriptional regulator with XRE-family HTH domain
MQQRAPNFADIIAGLQSAGLSQAEIARQARVSQPYISQIAQGARRAPSWPVGDALLTLALKHAGPKIIRKS